MRHANLPIEIIIKRYLWPERESPRRTERGTRGTREGAHLPPSVPPRVRRRIKLWRLLLLLHHHQPIIFDVRKSESWQEREKQGNEGNNGEASGGGKGDEWNLRIVDQEARNGRGGG